MQKLAFFDFCDTLVNFQTADAFVDFVRQNKGGICMKFLNIIEVILTRLRIIPLLNKVFPEKSLSKRIKLAQIRNMQYEILDLQAALFYAEIIKPNLILLVMAEMEKLAKQDYEICLVSAGYSIYIKYFAAEYHIQHFLTTEIAFDKSGKLCLGTFSGKDCIGNEKVKRIKSYFEGKNINFKESYAFSDSKTDLAMLLLAGNAVVVSRGESQFWSIQNNFEEIIWN
jgi:HAD superfamily hydrolase (TIGR01490 family)